MHDVNCCSVGEAPKLIGSLNDVTVVAPKSAVFDCDVSAGEPAGKIRWFRDGREIFAGSKYAMTYKRSSAQLTIYETEVDDKGVYKCEAANKLGSVNSTAKLSVQCKQSRICSKQRKSSGTVVHAAV